MALPSSKTDRHIASVNTAAQVFTEYGDFIYAVIRSKGMDSAQADDLFQDFFLSLVSRPPPTGIQDLRSYLYKAITNDIVDAIRRRKMYLDRTHRYAERLTYSATEDTPENALIKAEEMNKMLELIEMRLPPRVAQAVLLRYVNRHSINEIAKKLGLTSGCVRVYISAGLSRLRRSLSKSRRR